MIMYVRWNVLFVVEGANASVRDGGGFVQGLLERGDRGGEGGVFKRLCEHYRSVCNGNR